MVKLIEEFSDIIAGDRDGPTFKRKVLAFDYTIRDTSNRSASREVPGAARLKGKAKKEKDRIPGVITTLEGVQY